MKNILIIGASGFVGRALTREILMKKCNLFLVSRDKSFKQPRAKIFYGDIGGQPFCKNVLKNIDVVYYLAGEKKNIAFHVSEPFRFVAGNVSPFVLFLQILGSTKVKKLIYLSSTHVDYIDFSKQEIDGYAYGKYINEILVSAFVKESQINTTVVRSCAIYGPGDNFDPKTANFIPAMIHKIHKSKGEVVVWGRGVRRLQFIYIDDLVRNLIAAERTKKDIVDVGSPSALSVGQIVKKMIRFMGKDVKIKFDTTKPDKETQLHTFNNLIKPNTEYNQGLKSTIEYFLKYHG